MRTTITAVLLLLLQAAGPGLAARSAADKQRSDRLRAASGYPRRLHATSDFSGKATSLILGSAGAGSAESAGVLNARDFIGADGIAYSAKGDGKTDDAPALQKAIDKAQLSRLKLAIPAGVYLVNSTLRVHYNGGPDSVQWHNCTFPFDGNLGGPEYCPAALHMVGDGGWGLETIISECDNASPVASC